MNELKSRDIELWEAWNKSRNPVDLQNLLNQMMPIIAREVNKWAPSISRSLLEAEGKRLAVEAFRSYDPKRGVALSTYLASRLPKLSRLVYSTQNTARLSETNAVLYNTYNTARTQLYDTLGREPTVVELSDHLGWTTKKLTTFQRQAGRKEFVESEDHPDFGEEEDNLVDFIYHDLTPLQQSIFESTTGYRGSPRLTGAQICKKLKITQGQLSYQKGLIVKIVEQVRKHG